MDHRWVRHQGGASLPIAQWVYNSKIQRFTFPVCWSNWFDRVSTWPLEWGAYESDVRRPILQSNLHSKVIFVFTNSPNGIHMLCKIMELKIKWSIFPCINLARSRQLSTAYVLSSYFPWWCRVLAENRQKYNSDYHKGEISPSPCYWPYLCLPLLNLFFIKKIKALQYWNFIYIMMLLVEL